MRKLPKKVILLICVMSVFYMQGQGAENTDKIPKKVQFSVYYAAAYGNQGVAIPILLNKLLVNAEYNIIREVPVYASIGFTGGVAPLFGTHLETGIAFGRFTVDYSTNSFIGEVWDEEEEEEEERRISNGNLNLGFRFSFKKNGRLLWLRIGKSISEKGYDEEVQPIWNGYHAEVRIVL
ncbi:hypothetical protein [Aquimarina algiphila]|uniref:hypothetical protein n=1 Tax=Aquimarina algiphila TaxID=2047982 RepID=UPI00232B0CAB|nr:hypothetical protein [Aquimarina algiphila]